MAKAQRILVADDDDMVRSVVRTLLVFRGYHVEEAIDGQDAVNKYHQEGRNIDLVMMDVNMPVLSGREALQELRRLNPEVKVVLLSGQLHCPDPTIPQHTVRYLQKPFANDEFFEVVGHMLQPRETHA